MAMVEVENKMVVETFWQEIQRARLEKEREEYDEDNGAYPYDGGAEDRCLARHYGFDE